MILEELIKEVKDLINTKKVITPNIKSKLIELGFKETKIGTKKEHQINSKDIKINFHNYDIAIGISSVPYGGYCGRLYKAMTIKLNE